MNVVGGRALSRMILKTLRDVGEETDACFVIRYVRCPRLRALGPIHACECRGSRKQEKNASGDEVSRPDYNCVNDRLSNPMITDWETPLSWRT